MRKNSQEEWNRKEWILLKTETQRQHLALLAVFRSCGTASYWWVHPQLLAPFSEGKAACSHSRPVPILQHRNVWLQTDLDGWPESPGCPLPVLYGYYSAHAMNLLLDVSRKLGCASYFPAYFDYAVVHHLAKNNILDEDVTKNNRKCCFCFITDEQPWSSCINEGELLGLVLPVSLETFPGSHLRRPERSNIFHRGARLQLTCAQSIVNLLPAATLFCLLQFLTQPG